MDYTQANAYLGGKNDRPANDGRAVGNARVQRRGEAIALKYHETDVLTWYPDGGFSLNSGGWKTYTTKDRINRFCPSGWQVYQNRGVWYLSHGSPWDGNGAEWAFKDGIRVAPDGSVSGEGEDPAAQRKLRRKVQAFAKRYLEAFAAGKVGRPGAGDCFYCVMRTKEGKPLGECTGDTSHLLSHIEEEYFVPALLARVIEEPGISRAAHDWVVAHWVGPEQSETAATVKRVWGGIGREQVRKALGKYILRQLGAVA